MLQTIIIADDHPLFRNALKQTIDNSFKSTAVIEAHDIASLQEYVEQHPQANLILLDLHMPGAHGFSGLIYLTAHHPQIPVIVISAHESLTIIRRAMDHGAAGFLPKSSSMENIVNAIKHVIAGNLWLPKDLAHTTTGSSKEQLSIANTLSTLTPKQFRVATMLAQGLLNKQIGYELNITEATVKAHVTEVFRKLGVHSRTQAVLIISQLDVTPPNNDDLLNIMPTD